MKHEIIEDWQIIEDTEDMFAVSDRGRVCQIMNDGSGGLLIDVDEYGETNKRYKTIWLFGTKYYVHRLVATYFIDNPLGLTEVHHRDHNPKNNCVTNLEWTTVSYNNTLRTWHKQFIFNWKLLTWVKLGQF